MNKPNPLQDLAKQRYLEQINSLSSVQKKRMWDFTTFGLTLFAFTFFGLFAITPTLSTIVELQKQVADAKYTRDQLDQKKQTLSNLIYQYNNLSPDLPVVFRAIPQSPAVPTLLGQLQTLAKQNNLGITTLTTAPATLFDVQKAPMTSDSYFFSITATGSYKDLANFVSALTTFDRIITLQTIDITRQIDPNGSSNGISAEISGKAYYQK